MILRKKYLQAIEKEFDVHQVVAVLGPRQVGKTTLAKSFAESLSTNVTPVSENNEIFPYNAARTRSLLDVNEQGEQRLDGNVALFHETGVTHFDLENPLHLSRLKNPSLALKNIKGLVIIDEIQLIPELFSYIRHAVDEEPELKFLILGSASRDLINQSSETLAGRIGYIELTGFLIDEVSESEKLFARGGFPRSYLASSNENSSKWRHSFITTFLQRDLKALESSVTTELMGKLWKMLAHYHGNIINYSELGRSLQISDNTIRKYTEILSGCFMLRIVSPWHANIKKRQVKLPKIYIRDSGLLHSLLLVDTNENLLLNHPKLGAAWEGFALEQILNTNDHDEYYFWHTHNNAELDLLLINKGEKIGFEFKYTDSPKITKSMQISIKDLGLSKIIVVIPGKESFPLSEQISVRGLDNFI